MLFLSMVSVHVQKTRVLGTFTDSTSGDPLPLVSVALKGTNTGTSTDFEGMFSLESLKTQIHFL